MLVTRAPKSRWAAGWTMFHSHTASAAATGRLIAPELHLPVQLYDMERHYKAVKDSWAGFKGGLSE